MPVDPMIARPYVAQFGDTLREAMRTKVADDYRNALMQQRNNELAFEREQAAAGVTNVTPQALLFVTIIY